MAIGNANGTIGPANNTFTRPAVFEAKKKDESRDDAIQTRKIEETSDTAFIVKGVAATFDKPTVLFTDADGVEYKEMIDRHAFDSADMSNVVFLFNHDGKVMARTRNNTLSLWFENDGLHMSARMDGTDEGRSIYKDIKGGYLDRMSFSFTTTYDGKTYDDATRTITIKKIKRLYDVSVVVIPAYDSTSISVGSQAELDAVERLLLARARLLATLRRSSHL